MILPVRGAQFHKKELSLCHVLRIVALPDIQHLALYNIIKK